MVVYANKKYLLTCVTDHAVANENHTLFQPSTKTISSSEHIYKYTYGKGVYVASCSGGHIYSRDGVNWYRCTNGTTTHRLVCFAYDKFVAITDGGSSYITSTDGITWSNPVNTPTDSNEGAMVRPYYMDMCYGNGYLVAIGYYVDGSGSSIVVRGLARVYCNNTWYSPVKLSNALYLVSICYGNGKFVAVGSDSSYSNGYVVHSTDGGTWTALKVPNSTSHNHLLDVTHTGQMFVTVGTYGSVISKDGTTWVDTGILHNTFERVASYNGRLYTNDIDDGTYTSTDGLCWTKISDTCAYIDFCHDRFIYHDGSLSNSYKSEYTQHNLKYIPVKVNTYPTKYTLGYGLDTIYYKTVPLPNVVPVGKLEIKSGTACSGFSTSNYAKTNFYFAPSLTDTWEIVVSFNSGTNGKARTIISSEVDKTGFSLQINTSNKLVFYLSGTPGSWSIISAGVANTVLTADTSYLVKFTCDSTGFHLYLSSDDGETWAPEGGLTYGSEIGLLAGQYRRDYISPCRIIFGLNNTSGSNYLNGGSIYLASSYIKLNGKVVWKGQKEISSKNVDSTFSTPAMVTVGDIKCRTFNEQYIVTGFSSTCYMKPLLGTFPVSDDASIWSMKFRFRYKQTGVYQRIFSSGTSYPSGIEISTDGKICLTLTNSTSSYNIVNAVKGTTVLTDGLWYVVTVNRTYDDYYKVTLLNESTNTTTTEISANSTKKIKSHDSWLIGYEPNRNNGKTAFAGEIDLKNSSLASPAISAFWIRVQNYTVGPSNFDRTETIMRRYI